MSNLTKGDMEYIAYHCNNVYPDKYKYTARSIQFRKHNINGYVLKAHGAVYIFIAGTDELKDVVTDIRLAPSHFDGEVSNIKVHVGFEAALKKVEDIIIHYARNETRVIIAGHSMGGAIATLAAYKLVWVVPNIICVTFGSPRVGNRAFIKNFNKLVTASYRVVYRNDAVTRWPKLLFWYRHVDTLYQSKRKRWFSFFTAIFDHPMQNYVDGIRDDMWTF